MICGRNTSGIILRKIAAVAELKTGITDPKNVSNAKDSRLNRLEQGQLLMRLETIRFP